jgi:diguanylate cyclase (GGDEF)-like protein
VLSFRANSRNGRQRILRLLAVFAVTLVSLGSVVALVVYADAHSSIAAHNLVTHTQANLLDLSDISRELDRIELNTLLYRSTGEEDYQRAAQAATVATNTFALRLQKLVEDNPTEERRAQDLVSAAATLAKLMAGPIPTRASVREQVVHCRLILNLMQDEERSLLTARQEDAQRDNLYALARRTATIVIGALLVLVLFGFLLRDAVRRAQFEEQLSDTAEKMRLTVQRLEEQATESRLLIAARDEVALCVEIEQAEQCTVRYLEQLLPGTSGTLSVVNNSRHLLETVAAWGGAGDSLADSYPPEACCALRSGRSRWRAPQLSEVHCSHFTSKPPEWYLCVPLVAHGETLGTLTIHCPGPESYAGAQAHENTIDSLAEMAAMAMAGLHLRQKLEIQSIRDGMTGLFNRSFMEVALERELHRASRLARQIAVMMLDIDHFKQFNDAFGHEAGDVVLREVAECLRVQVRVEDIVCRYGGEEFVIILPEIATQAAMERAELLRQMVSNLSVRFHGQPLRQVTVSIGVAIYPDMADSPETLLRGADIAMYAAKHRGRNRVAQAENTALL